MPVGVASTMKQWILAAGTIAALGSYAQTGLALTVDGLLEANEYANHYTVQMPGQTGLSDLYFTDTGVDTVNFYFRFNISTVDNTYGDNADPAYGQHRFAHLVSSDNLTLEFDVGTITLDYLATDGSIGQPGESYETCGTLSSSNCADSLMWNSANNADGGTSGIDATAVVVETSLDYNLNHMDGFVHNASANDFTTEQKFAAVTDVGTDDGSSPIDAPANASALSDPNNLWLTYVGYEFSIERSALQLGSGETFDVSKITSLTTHISPPKEGPDQSTCVVFAQCSTEVPTPPSGDVPVPATILLFASALLMGARGMRRRQNG